MRPQSWSQEHSRPILRSLGLGIGLERQGLGLGLDTYGLGLVLKGRSQNVSRPAVFGTCALNAVYGAVISRIGIFITKCHGQEHILQ